MSITVDAPIQARLRALSRLTGASQANIIIDLMEAALPQLDRLIVDLHEAQQQRQAAERGLHGLLGTKDVASILTPPTDEAPVTRRRRMPQQTAGELLKAIKEDSTLAEVDANRRRGKARGAKQLED